MAHEIKGDKTLFDYTIEKLSEQVKNGTQDERVKVAADILQYLPPTKSKVEIPNRGNGGSTNYYYIPPNAKGLKDIIKYKKMEHGIGEAFCALYRLNDNGEYLRNLNKALYYIQAEIEHYKETHKKENNV